MNTNMDQFNQGHNQFSRFGNQNQSLNVVQIQPANGDFTNNHHNNGNMNGNMNNMNMGNVNNMSILNNMNNMKNNMNNMNNMNMNNYNNNGNGNGNGNYNNNKKPSKRKAETYTCTVCAIEVSSQDVLQSHMNGQKHAKKLRQIAVSYYLRFIIKV